MQPYEIRQFRDGSIDYNLYFARPVNLLTPTMRRFGRMALAPAAFAVLAMFVALTAAAWAF